MNEKILVFISVQIIQTPEIGRRRASGPNRPRRTCVAADPAGSGRTERPRPTAADSETAGRRQILRPEHRVGRSRRTVRPRGRGHTAGRARRSAVRIGSLDDRGSHDALWFRYGYGVRSLRGGRRRKNKEKIKYQTKPGRASARRRGHGKAMRMRRRSRRRRRRRWKRRRKRIIAGWHVVVSDSETSAGGGKIAGVTREGGATVPCHVVAVRRRHVPATRRQSTRRARARTRSRRPHAAVAAAAACDREQAGRRARTGLSTPHGAIYAMHTYVSCSIPYCCTPPRPLVMLLGRARVRTARQRAWTNICPAGTPVAGKGGLAPRYWFRYLFPPVSRPLRGGKKFYNVTTNVLAPD